MQVTARELWTVLHGLIFGSVFLAAFAGGLAGLYSLRPELVTVAGVRERVTVEAPVALSKDSSI